MSTERAVAPIRLVFYPDYRASNPYQALLYDALRPTVEARPGTVEDALALQARRPEPAVVFHLHWDDAVTWEADARRAEAAARTLVDGIERFLERGGRVVWTVHNLEPHSGRHVEIVAETRDRLFDLVNLVHVHSGPALAAVRSRWRFDPWKARVILHGDYAAAYPRVDQEAARAAFELPEDGMCALLPGRIAGYKGPSDLVEAFLDHASPADRLVVAGQFVEARDPATLGRGDPRVLIRPGFADAAAMAQAYAAADLVALPYRCSLTSGSAILAATLERGVLGPEEPGLRDAVEPPRTGVLYDAGRKGAFGDALAAALADGREVWRARGLAALETTLARDWRIIGAQWRDVLNALLAGAPPVRIAP